MWIKVRESHASGYGEAQYFEVPNMEEEDALLWVLQENLVYYDGFRKPEVSIVNRPPIPWIWDRIDKLERDKVSITKRIDQLKRHLP